MAKPVWLMNFEPAGLFGGGALGMSKVNDDESDVGKKNRDFWRKKERDRGPGEEWEPAPVHMGALNETSVDTTHWPTWELPAGENK